MLTLTPRSSFAAEYSFKDGAIQDWKKTATLSAEPAAPGLHLSATGYDAKLYRSVKLEPGHYVLYGRGMGGLKLMVLPDWESQPYCVLNLPAKAVGTDYRDFEIPEGAPQNCLLAAWIPSNTGQGDLEWIKVENAPGVPTDKRPIPTPDELAKERPDPPVTRGFNLPGKREVSKETFQEIKDWGANAVRLQIFPVDSAKILNKPLWDAWPEILNQMERSVINAESVGLKIIIDLHLPPIPEIVEKRTFDKPDLWQHPDLETSFVRVWSDIAQKLKPHSKTIWAYDLYNEPLDRSQLPWAPREWYPLAVKILDAIRVHDPDVWIVFETGPGGMSRGFEGLVPLPDKRIIYNVHDYDPAEFTHQGIAVVGGLDKTNFAAGKGIAYPTPTEGGLFTKEVHEKKLKAAIDFQKKWQVPMFVGEFSVIRWAPKDDAVQWLKDTIEIYESMGWSWSYHGFREYHGWSLEHDETHPPDIHVPVPPVTYETDRAKVVKEAFQKNSL